MENNKDDNNLQDDRWQWEPNITPKINWLFSLFVFPTLFS